MSPKLDSAAVRYQDQENRLWSSTDLDAKPRLVFLSCVTFGRSLTLAAAEAPGGPSKFGLWLRKYFPSQCVRPAPTLCHGPNRDSTPTSRHTGILHTKPGLFKRKLSVPGKIMCHQLPYSLARTFPCQHVANCAPLGEAKLETHSVGAGCLKQQNVSYF